MAFRRFDFARCGRAQTKAEAEPILFKIAHGKPVSLSRVSCQRPPAISPQLGPTINRSPSLKVGAAVHAVDARGPISAGPSHHRIGSARNFSTRHCSLRPTTHMSEHWQAPACPRAAQQKRRRTEVSVPHSGSPGTVGRHDNIPNRVAFGCVCHKHPPPRRPRAACGASGGLTKTAL